MKPIRTFNVTPSLPEELGRLPDLAYNLRWTWDNDTIELFRRLDSDLWERTGHNPVLMLGMIDQEHLNTARTDEGFLAHLQRVARDLDDYMNAKSTWWNRTHDTAEQPLIAYFSAEFGVTECISIFAGGLGVLSGDHLKSASDLGLPLVGVGLLYQQGYFRQYLNEAGWQQERYEDNDFHNLPVKLQRNEDGSPLLVAIPYPGRTVNVQVWRAQVGRVPLFLLDTNVGSNRPEDRDISDQLYGGDLEMRLKQEILIGIGGYRALKAMGLAPTVFHFNEGHSAFLSLERIRDIMQQEKVSFAEAREAASCAMVFTTHTPVPAGHDTFPSYLMEMYFKEYAATFGLTTQEFLAMGKQNPEDFNEPFCLTTLALRLAAYSNAVSRLHGHVSRHMWQRLWPDVPEHEVPITHVTNGIHLQSWVSKEMKDILDRYIGPRWRSEPADRKLWDRAEHISAEELWRTHERRRERLVSFVRKRLRQQLVARGASTAEIEAADDVLSPKALTIGFARRFATYKRATLILRNLDRLDTILNKNKDRPVQIIFAGKAHPKDDPGKALIQKIVSVVRDERFRTRMVFLEDYAMTAARYLVQGVDVWLNTPLRPREASGTSGMKAAANGVPNVSVLDGWWEEAYQPAVGWAIGRGETYSDHNYQDQVEAQALYDLLEHEVIPQFYTRGPDGLPRLWIDRMKKSLEKLCVRFNTHRMVAEYTDRFYVPASRRAAHLTANHLAAAKALAAWKAQIAKGWPQVKVKVTDGLTQTDIQVGRNVVVKASVELGALRPEDVAVELYMGRVNPDGEFEHVEARRMELVSSDGKGGHVFSTRDVKCTKSGLHGFTVRVIPHHQDMGTKFIPGLIAWAEKTR